MMMMNNNDEYYLFTFEINIRILKTLKHCTTVKLFRRNSLGC